MTSKPAGQLNGEHPLRRIAEEILARSRGAPPSMQDKTMEELVHELQVHQIELEMQNEELKQAQLALEISRDRYIDLYDLAPIGYFVFSEKALIADVNLTGAALLGVERPKLVNGRFRSFVTVQDQERWDQHLLSVLGQGGKHTCELALKTRDGALLNARLESVRIEGPAGFNLVRSAVSDITRQARAEEAVRRRAAELERLHSAAAGLNAAQAQEDVLHCLLGETLAALGMECGAIWLASAGGELGLALERSSASRPGWPGRLGLELATWVHEQETRVIAADLARCAEVPANARADLPAGWSGACVPLAAGDEPVGALLAAAHRPEAIGADQERVLDALVAMASVTLQRLRLREASQEQARRVRQIVESVPEGMLLLDTAGRIELVNPAAESMLGLLTEAQPGEALTHLGGRPLADLLALTPAGLQHEVGGGGRTIEVTARAIGDQPAPAGWVLVLEDVTVERQVRRQLEEQERLATVGQLAAGIAHDFNNIMAVIILEAQLAARAPAISDRDRAHLETIVQQVTHASHLVQQILDFGRRALLDRQPLDLRILLREQSRLLERTLPESIAVKFYAEPGIWLVHADPTRMQQMVANLALNARDAMPAGGVLQIRLGRAAGRGGDAALPAAIDEGEWIRVQVCDTGTGIPPEVLPHIFEPFYTTKEPGKGSGLGLSQVYGIVKQHAGHLVVDTLPGAGSTFSIYLPALTVEVPRLALPESEAVPEGSGELVLVVEDDAMLREALAAGLIQLNYRTALAADGQQALELVEAHGEQVAVILSDVVMPLMDGIALLRTLRERGNRVPVILMTGHPMETELKALAEKQNNVWFFKPLGMEQLARAVADALHPKQTGRPS